MRRARTIVLSAQAGQRAAMMMSGAVLTVTGMCGLYLVKSWLGLNLMAGHVPILHDLLYPLVRG